ncbi:MAG TPA: PDR/VanB family oxidoreductase [Burkholderiaceae bacterium]|nr:PDR/VanB family oxidoreductase [Burkholderiaceae bacterium]
MNELRVRVTQIADEAEGIRSFTLAPTDGTPLPPWEPGGHIDVHLKPGLTRQYSLTNGPDETDAYRIAVKREPVSRGGSGHMHAEVRVGSELLISPARNNFPLAENASRHLLLAGGIGITPVLAMGKHLHARQEAFALHYFARGPQHAAFVGWLDQSVWREQVNFHYGMAPDEQRGYLKTLLGQPDEGTHLYMCGPGAFMDMVDAVARECGWPARQVHCEYFSAPAPVDSSGQAFELVLAKSQVRLRVEPHMSMLDAMRGAGIEIETSCEQGVCGTCLSKVLEGTPDHRDLYLNPDEQALGTMVLPCVSRSCSARLVLDL